MLVFSPGKNLTLIQMMTIRENILRAVRFERPEYIPAAFHINPACWEHYGKDVLEGLMEAHPFLFPDFMKQKTAAPVYRLNQRKDQPYTDPWGCVWQTTCDGISGSVHNHPLEDWEAFNSYRAPDPGETDGVFPVDWKEAAARIRKQKSKGDLTSGGLPHGHTLMRLQNLRGFENLIFDMADGEPNLVKLIEMVERFNCRVVDRWLALEPDIMQYPEDLGMQSGPMISPEHFQRYIKPIYKRLIQPAKEADCLIHMHSDGDIRSLVRALLDCGIDIINLQDLVNGIDWIASNIAGHVCIDLDIDRQKITARGTPEDIDRLIREEVVKLGSPEGGLMMVYGLYPGMPIKNIRALMDAMEKYSTYYS